MALVKKQERYVRVAYELCCGYQKSTALAQDLCNLLRNDEGLQGAEDDTRGWDGDKLAVVLVDYRSLADAFRLDKSVRQLLSRSVSYTYTDRASTGYGNRGAYLIVDASTTVTPKQKQT